MSLGEIAETLLDIAFTLFGFHIDIGNLGKTAKELCDWNQINASSLGTLAETLNGIIIPFGLSILGVFVMIDLIKKALDIERTSFQQVAMTLVRFIIYKTMITYCYDFLKVIMKIGQDIFTSVIDAIAYSETTTISIGQTMGELIDNAEGGITIPIINWSIMPLILFMVFLIIY